jgi:predicted 2-oxoglutarate/Fe(II)-dependent dioxygenase YbiX
LYNAYVEEQIKPQALARFGTDDLDKLEADGIITDRTQVFDYYWADKIYFVKDISQELLDNINQRLKNFLNPGYDFRGLATIQKHGKDQFLGYHYDNAFEKDIEFAVALYINDNYDGGELHFPLEKDLQQNEDGTWSLINEKISGVVIQPRAGDLAIFSTTGDYVHGVRPVSSDSNRYAIVSFIRPE